MKLFYSPLLLLILLACNQQQKTENVKSDSNAVAVAPTTPKEMLTPGMPNRQDTAPQKPAVNPYEKATIEVKTFQNKEGAAKGTWGYNIFLDNNQYITQPSIPAVPGNNGFATEEKARKAGQLVAYKIKHNIMPPAVSPQELDSIGVLN